VPSTAENQALFAGQAFAAQRYSGRDKAADTSDNIRQSDAQPEQ
jgi:hypothetical protein